jgi:hypothetical protein
VSLQAPKFAAGSRAGLQRAGDVRGEFIRLQVLRAAEDRRLDRTRRSEESAREFELLQRFGAQRAAEVGVKTRHDATRDSFHRGFVAAVTVATVAEAEAVLQHTPIEHVSCETRGADYTAFLTAAFVPRLRAMTLWHVTQGDDIAFVAARQAPLEAGYAIKTYPCALAAELEARHGARAWLHQPWDREEEEPDGWLP